MANAVVKRDGKFFMGSLEIKLKKLKGKVVMGGYAWSAPKPVKKLSDVKEAHDYITLRKWLKEKECVDSPEEVLKRCGMESIYILDKPVDPTAKEFENYWWAEINKVCVDCIKDCKQSAKVILVNCPKRKVK